MRKFLYAVLLFSSISCSDDNTTAPPTLESLLVSLPSTSITLGQTITATASGIDQHGAAITTGSVAWSSSATAIATIDAATGTVTGVSAGTTRVIATVGDKAGEQTITVTAPPAIKINEVESNGGTPDDWVELYNTTSAVVDVSGWIIRDNEDSQDHTYRIPNGTTIAAGGYLVIENAALGYGLGGNDSVRLSNQYDVRVDAVGWTSHAPTTYGLCPDGTGAFATTSASTKGTANTCTPTGPGGPTAVQWPGNDNVQTIDGSNVFGTNMSGLAYESANGANPAVLWAVKNGAGTLYRLIWNGTIWTPDASNGWSAGKLLRYTDGTGDPDAEGVTFSGTGSTGGMYVSTERNNASSGTSRNSILRFDPTQAGTSLTATNEWNLTSDLPSVGANLGMEAITWVPDTYLVANGFYDEKKQHTYNPSEYPNHGTGLFFIGLEANGMIYAYALDHSNNTFTRVAEFSSGFAGVMDLEFDRDNKYLWITCDNGCGNKSTIFQINTAVGAATKGRFTQTHLFNRPSTLPDVNNEGFTITPESACVGGQKEVFWSDDDNTGGHAIRRGSVRCGAIP